MMDIIDTETLFNNIVTLLNKRELLIYHQQFNRFSENERWRVAKQELDFQMEKQNTLLNENEIMLNKLKKKWVINKILVQKLKIGEANLLMEQEKYDELKHQFIKNYPHQVNNFSEQELKMAQHNVWKMILDNYFLLNTPKIIQSETFKTFKNLFIKVCKLLQQNLKIFEADLKLKLKIAQLLINQNDNPEMLDLNNIKSQIKTYKMQLTQNCVNNSFQQILLTALGTQFSTITNEIQTPTKESINDLKTQIEILNHKQKMLILLTNEIPSLFQELCSSNDFLIQENIIIASIKHIVTTSNNNTVAITNDKSSFSKHSSFVNRLRI